MILMQRKRLSSKMTRLGQDPEVCREGCLLGPRWDFCYIFFVLEIITGLECIFKRLLHHRRLTMSYLGEKFFSFEVLVNWY